MFRSATNITSFPSEGTPTNYDANLNESFRFVTVSEIPTLNQFSFDGTTRISSLVASAPNWNQDISGIDYSNMNNMANMTGGSPFSTVNYDLLLANLALNPPQPNTPLGVGTTQYSASSQANRDILTNSPNFMIITDGGVAP